ncbi:MAG: L,D-transpeptidase family protein [Candidatus Methylumidiphilus sp.]
MKIANPMAAMRWLLPWLALAAVLCQPAMALDGGQLLPLGINLPALDGKTDVDPRASLTVEAVGMGAQVLKAELLDDTGKVLAEGGGDAKVTLSAPMAFGARHTLKVTAERAWLQQRETRQISFTTVSLPKLDGTPVRMLGTDGAVSLRFDQPVGEVAAKGDLTLKAETDETRRIVRLVASGYAQDKTYPVQLEWKTATGVPLPPLALELTTAPPLAVESTNVKGQSNLGTALPLMLTFSENLADRPNAGRNVKIHTVEGVAVAGKWEWQGPKKMKFTPQPGWPASSTIEVSIEPQSLRSERGGTLEKPWATRFTIGADRHLFVYLDAQRLEVVENGQVVRTIKVSTGKAKTPTVTGNFYIYDRYPHKTMRSDVGPGQRGYYQVDNVPYTQFFHKDYAFHGAFWHNGFGHPASHGCVNLSTKDHNRRWPNAPEDAGWLYHWAALGVPVTVMAKAPAPMQAGNNDGKAPPPTKAAPVAAPKSALPDGAKAPLAGLAPDELSASQPSAAPTP